MITLDEIIDRPSLADTAFERLRRTVHADADAGLDDRFRAADALRRWAEAELAVVAGEVDRRRAWAADAHLNARGWMRSTGNWSSAEALRAKRRARLFELAPAVGQALVDGHIGLAQVDALARGAANPRCGDGIVPFVPLFLELATKVGFDDFARAARYWEQFADADGAFREREATVARRRARVQVTDGVVHVEAVGGALAGAEMKQIFDEFVKAELLTDRAEAAATGSAELPRTDDQRRFDALHAIFLAAACTPADAQRPEPSVHLACDMGTWMEHLALRGMVELKPDYQPPDPLSRWCVTSDGVVLHPADVFAAAVVGTTRRIVFDSIGVPVDLGRRSRFFRNGARDAVRWVATHCTQRGCDQPESWCDTDHLTQWTDEGHTRPDNGAPACRGHNRARQRGFRVRRDDEGYWHTYRPDGTEIT